jgi:arylsulfatase
LFTVHHKAVSSMALPAGASTVAVAFEKLGDKGRATISIDGKACGSVEVPRVLRMISSNGMDAGRDAGSPVGEGYEPPFAFKGKIKRLVFEMLERPKRDERLSAALAAKAAMKRQ